MGSGSGRSKLQGRYLLAACGAIVLLVVVCTRQFPSLGQRLFGPPTVKMHEAYAASPRGPNVNHEVLDKLLKAHVDADGFVDYPSLKKDRGVLEAYIESLETVPFERIDRDQKLALLINAYNAFTLQLIIEHYPLASIRDIPKRKRWAAVRWKIGRHTWSLNQIEHEQIRAKFLEPRVHFALVCASVGCPPLRREVYTADNLESQFHDQCMYVHTHDRWCVLDEARREIRLTRLYDWYGDDFKQGHKSVLAFVEQFVPRLNEMRRRGRDPQVRWLPYDWSLNDRAR